MKATAALQNFVDDELLRAPMLFEQAIDATLASCQSGPPGASAGDRAAAAELPQRLQSLRPRLVDTFVRSLRTQVGAEIAGQRTPAIDALSDVNTLSLVDEGEVAVDVELSRTIEAIKSVAEYELRELLTFTSALAGDMDVARDTNPFRAETQARALWAAAQALPMSSGHQVAFMRLAALPFARVLRKVFAAACARLEAAGVEPAAYRTLILPPGARRPRMNDTTVIPELGQLHAGLLAREAPMLGLRTVVEPSLVLATGGTAVDTQSVDLLTRLFDAILAHRRLPADIGLLMSRLQPCALRVMLHDKQALESFQHPIWRFMDRLAFLAEIVPGGTHPERTRLLAAARRIVDHVAEHAQPDAELFLWSAQRLDAQEAHRLELRCTTAAARIMALQRLEDRLAATEAPPSTLAGTLDLQQLDTVPAELLDALAPAGTSADADSLRWLEARRSGDWLRIFMQGQWLHAQLLWPGERGEVWLLEDAEATATWAVRRRALLTLHAAKLLELLQPRSLVRDAAKQVARQLGAAMPG